MAKWHWDQWPSRRLLIHVTVIVAMVPRNHNDETSLVCDNGALRRLVTTHASTTGTFMKASARSAKLVALWRKAGGRDYNVMRALHAAGCHDAA